MWFRKKKEPSVIEQEAAPIPTEDKEWPFYKPYTECDYCHDRKDVFRREWVEIPGHIWPRAYFCSSCYAELRQKQKDWELINTPEYKATIIDSGTQISKLLGVMK